MTGSRSPTSMAASVRARLYNLSRQRGVELQLLLSEFATERLLYRLGASEHKDRFVLKGAMLFRLWTDVARRATWDLDLLGHGENSPAKLVEIFKNLCSMQVPDGILFDPGAVIGEEIRSTAEYTGVRVLLEARLVEARIRMQVDIGFGDAMVPGPTWETYPTLLDHPPPRILVYPREVAVAEKIDAMLTLGVTNSRIKDFYDIHVLASTCGFEGPKLAKAIRATLKRRGTPCPESLPLVMTREFLAAPERQTLWRAFLRRGRLSAPPDVAELAAKLGLFLGPVFVALRKGEPFGLSWPPGGPWG